MNPRPNLGLISFGRKAFFLLLVLAVLPCQAGETRRTIDSMNFRKAPAGDPILGPKFTHKEAFYAIQPPAGWKQVPKAGDKNKLEYASLFKNRDNGDFLSIGLVKGGPPRLTLEGLSRFRGDYLGQVRRSGAGRIIGSDLFRFNHFHCLQVLVQKNDTIVLQLLVFSDPGAFLQMAFSVGKGRYRILARAMEASIASLEWPAL